MKRGIVLTTFIFLQSIVCWSAHAQAQNSRAATAASYLDRAAGWLSKGELDRAIADFDLAIASDPTIAVAFYNRGDARSRKRDPEGAIRSEEHTSELQSLRHLVCRLLLEK